MLRIILGCTGAALIGFGIFGGQALEATYERLAGVTNPVATDIPASPDSTSPVVVASPAVDALTDKSASNPVEQESIDDRALIAVQTTTPASATPLGAVEIESADAERMTEVPASARNSEVAIARSLLGGSISGEPASAAKVANAAPALLASVSKEDEVAEVMKTTADVPPKTLIVLKESVNLRRGPSVEHPVVLRLDKGQELMEFKRDGRWVHVGAYGTSGKIGWVHRTLVGPG